VGVGFGHSGLRAKAPGPMRGREAERLSTRGMEGGGATSTRSLAIGPEKKTREGSGREGGREGGRGRADWPWWKWLTKVHQVQRVNK